ncbi:unnamed protein product [Gordionus sp. m RMFG-2023]
MDFDYHIHIADLLADKAIIPSKSEWIHEFDHQAHRSMYGYFPVGPKYSNRSALINFIIRYEFCAKVIIDMIDSNIIPDSLKFLVAIVKNNELKLVGRFYGKMTPEMRIYQVCTEKNLADFILPYIAGQTMTMSEEKLQGTICQMTAPYDHNSINKHFIVKDFSSWGTNFRSEFVTPTFLGQSCLR